ncbi:RNA polymerase subunit AC19 [Elasticomyces elasticus]|uniref:RNA polymerase subunit AC19 n=1 Tax=Exophiala sideris TaxID=1016849 RepID=A0ABR0JL08_9EURO|nr:RNA polymerase subunit AC19 [Elasticomyces elasticus]KAK5032212.1 RNA polymerase subunit AC19 [Exophiala sideris]KAK5036210.1 RNA polymerase subunit AC19 [Exophiala sideris]KAK5066593.1 RNA polymerase subunit AC19 [Exophiala sideris]KAK5180415.1 RNA polymerase subunit AC19 [Eurotiomycetes sp. CCFEE 6388]
MSEHDVQMEDENFDQGEEISLGGAKKLRILDGGSTHAASFQIEKEDHTMGNALRYFVNKNPDVEFCGYTIPHPSETKMNIRIQTWEDTKTTAIAALRKGLEDMMEACDVISAKFTESRDQFDAAQS